MGLGEEMLTYFGLSWAQGLPWSCTMVSGVPGGLGSSGNEHNMGRGQLNRGWMQSGLLGRPGGEGLDKIRDKIERVE